MKKLIGILLLGVAAVTYAGNANAQGYNGHYYKHGRQTAMYHHPHGHAYGHYKHHGRGHYEHHRHGHDHVRYR